MRKLNKAFGLAEDSDFDREEEQEIFEYDPLVDYGEPLLLKSESSE